MCTRRQAEDPHAVSECRRPDTWDPQKDWSPVTMEQAASDARLAYVASKTFAERAAWDFADREKPHFSIATVRTSRTLPPFPATTCRRLPR